MGKLDGKVALITGGNSGIGLATAKLFVSEGAKVMITGRRPEALDEAIQEIGSDAQSIVADAGDISKAKEVVETTVAAFGKIDILFTNAGSAKFINIADITEEIFDTQYNVTVKGVYFLIKEAIPHLNDGGVIIGNTSVTSHRGFEGVGVYGGAKAAIGVLTKVLAVELGKRNIRSVCVSPGPIDTPIFDKFGVPEEALDGMMEAMAQQIPLGRIGNPEEIAKTVLFLASEDASFINGISILADGGMGESI